MVSVRFAMELVGSQYRAPILNSPMIIVVPASPRSAASPEVAWLVIKSATEAASLKSVGMRDGSIDFTGAVAFTGIRKSVHTGVARRWCDVGTACITEMRDSIPLNLMVDHMVPGKNVYVCKSQKKSKKQAYRPILSMAPNDTRRGNRSGRSGIGVCTIGEARSSAAVRGVLA